jgi:hypothetical protein
VDLLPLPHICWRHFSMDLTSTHFHFLKLIIYHLCSLLVRNKGKIIKKSLWYSCYLTRTRSRTSKLKVLPKFAVIAALMSQSTYCKNCAINEGPLQDRTLCNAEDPYEEGKDAPYGAIMGYAPGNIPAYSCDYEYIEKAKFNPKSQNSYRHEVDGYYYGYKYQCVEFARRWLIHAMGVTFGDIRMAYQIFDLPHAICVRDSSPVAWKAIPNGSSPKPVRGSVMIWTEDGEFERTGHVAIVTDVSDNWVRVAEQNVDDEFWAPDHDYARELAADFDPETGNFMVHETWGKKGGKIRGWMMFPDDYVAEPIPIPEEEEEVIVESDKSCST